MEKPVVQLEGLTFTYAGSLEPALKDIELTVHPGEFVVLTGPSGCGKSTLSFCLTGFIPHSFDGTMEGRALIGGRDTRSAAAGELAGIAGLVQQDPEAQLCTLHVAEEVAFGPENLGLPVPEIARRLEWALAAAGISDLRERSLHTLSGGEKQRVAIAGALAMRPQLFILDEPTANLDPRGCREVLAVVEKLRREENTAIIIFEHRLQYLLPFADRLIMMERGRFTAAGLPEQLVRSGRLSDSCCHRSDPVLKLVGRKALPVKSAQGAESAPRVPKTPGGQDRAAPLLSVERLTVGYEQQAVLEEITFSLQPGETAALMGDNGCGKSTLLLALLGILKPEQGRICFAGNDLAGCRVTRRAREMGLTFQNANHQLFEKTVFKEAGLPSQFLGGDRVKDRTHLEQLLVHFDLECYREKLPFALSQGEKKRLTLVSVLAYRPSILLLDRPQVGQDQDRLDLLMEALREHSLGGGITLMAIHEPAVVASCCTRVLFLEKGKLLIDAPTAGAFAELARQGKDHYLPADHPFRTGSDV